MRIAVISDVHGNITALEAVLRDLRSVEHDRLVCLGDLAYKGNCDNPNQGRRQGVYKESD